MENLSAVDLTNATFYYDYEEPYDIMKERWVRVILIAIYGLILITGVSGNLLVIYVVLSKRVMRTITNMFIVNLALR